MKLLILFAFILTSFAHIQVRADDEDFDIDTVAAEEQTAIQYENNFDRMRAAKQSKRSRLPKIEETEYNGGKTNLDSEDLAGQLFSKKYGKTPAAENSEKIVLQEPAK